MEEGGMTDLQFKCHLRMIISLLEHVEKAETLEKMREELDNLKNLFLRSLEG